MIERRTQQTDDRHERGAVFLEYGLLITLIAGVVALTVGPFGGAVAALIMQAADAFP